MRATDGRPYELQSVPTKTVAVRSTDNCADLVQNLVCTLAFPLCKGRWVAAWRQAGGIVPLAVAGIALPTLVVGLAASSRQ